MKKRLYWLGGFLLLLIILYFSRAFWLEGAASWLIVRDKLQPAVGIIVLAGDVNGERVTEGVKLYKEGYAHKMIMSGGPLTWRLSAAAWMKKQAVTMGVPSEAIWLEDRSRSTYENATFSLPFAERQKWKSVLLVTSPTHSRRAKMIFARIFTKAGIKTIIYPAEVTNFKLSGWWQRHDDTQLVVWEYVSLVYYFLKGYWLL